MRDSEEKDVQQSKGVRVQGTRGDCTFLAGGKSPRFFVAMAWPGEEVDSRPLKVESVWRSGVVDALMVMKLILRPPSADSG